MLALALTAAAEAAEQERELPMPAWAFGLLALASFAALLALTYSFRSAGHKQGEKHTPGS